MVEETVREKVTSRTVKSMVEHGFSWSDEDAIVFLSNNVIKKMIRRGEISKKQAQKLSENVTIKEVKRDMRRYPYMY